MKINAGDILVASKEMNDEYFGNSVILISAVSPQAVVGFIINRKSTMPASELFDNLDDFYKNLRREVFIGGPVEDNSLHMIAYSSIGGQEIIPGLRMGGHFETVEEMLGSDERQNRLMLGYTAWGPEQLQGEISDGSWKLYKNANVFDVFFEIDNGNMLTSEVAMKILGEVS
jgi:putative transcriptional regulator